MDYQKDINEYHIITRYAYDELTNNHWWCAMINDFGGFHWGWDKTEKEAILNLLKELVNETK